MRDIEQDRKRLETAICYSDDGDWARSALRDYMDECERLRAEVDTLRIESGGLHQMLDGAQRENEALRAARQEWRSRMGLKVESDIVQENEALRAECERLRLDNDALGKEVHDLRSFERIVSQIDKF